MTNAASNKPGIYQSHRDHQTERILDAAERLFVRDGIDPVSMSAIADEARIARKTVYRYFSDKDAVAFAIYQKLVDELIVTVPHQPGGSGYDQLEQFMAWMRAELVGNHDHQRFLIEFNTLYARQPGVEQLHKMISPTGSGVSEKIALLIRDGIADGSLRTDLEPEKVAAAFLNLLIGMNARFTLLGRLISQEYGQSEQDIYQEICRIFLSGIQSHR